MPPNAEDTSALEISEGLTLKASGLSSAYMHSCPMLSN